MRLTRDETYQKPRFIKTDIPIRLPVDPPPNHHHHLTILGHNLLLLMQRPTAMELQSIVILPQQPHPEALSADLDSIRWDECLSLGRGSTVKRITQNSPMRCPLSLSLTPCQLLWIHPYIPPHTVPQCVCLGCRGVAYLCPFSSLLFLEDYIVPLSHAPPSHPTIFFSKSWWASPLGDLKTPSSKLSGHITASCFNVTSWKTSDAHHGLVSPDVQNLSACIHLLKGRFSVFGKGRDLK